MMKQYDALALFSGGLDSILAARLMMEQGKKILCLHFTSPFLGITPPFLFGKENTDWKYCLLTFPTNIVKCFAVILQTALAAH